MLYGLLSEHFTDTIIVLIGALSALFITFILYIRPFGFLPRDGGKFVTDKDGKRVAINEKSAGKITGAGIIFVPVFVICCFLFLPYSLELTLNLLLCLIMMIMGYADDASKAPFGELLKGILDLILAVMGGVVFVLFNPTDIRFLTFDLHLHPVVYVILATALIWGSINVTNCSDGVDGLCGGVTVVQLYAYILIFGASLGVYSGVAIILASVVLAYLTYNWFPSKVLMGDAGSRTIGFVLALMAMQSGHPFIFVILSFVFLFDGGLGLVRLVLLRTIKKNIFSKIRFPFHDQLRKVKGWSVPKTALFFIIAEVIFAGIAAGIIFIGRTI